MGWIALVLCNKCAECGDITEIKGPVRPLFAGQNCRGLLSAFSQTIRDPRIQRNLRPKR